MFVAQFFSGRVVTRDFLVDFVVCSYEGLVVVVIAGVSGKEISCRKGKRGGIFSGD